MIAGNLCKDFYRKNREIALEELPEEPDLGAEAGTGENPEKYLEIKLAFAGLPEEIRERPFYFSHRRESRRRLRRYWGLGCPL